MLTLFPSDSGPILALIRADDERVPVPLDKGEQPRSRGQVGDVISEVHAPDPLLRRAVHVRAVPEPEAPQRVLSPRQHPATAPARGRRPGF